MSDRSILFSLNPFLNPFLDPFSDPLGDDKPLSDPTALGDLSAEFLGDEFTGAKPFGELLSVKKLLADLLAGSLEVFFRGTTRPLLMDTPRIRGFSIGTTLLNLSSS